MLSNFYIEEHVKQALQEDIGFGDITTESIMTEDKIFHARLTSRVEGVVCGLEVFKTVYKVLSDKVEGVGGANGYGAVCASGEKVLLGYTVDISKPEVVSAFYSEITGTGTHLQSKTGGYAIVKFILYAFSVLLRYLIWTV